MGSSRWRLANTKRQRGRLDRIKDFLPASDGPLAACSVVVPVSMDPAAGGLVSAGTRSFEL